ncbi:hypothetical protein COU89_00715 [Candidatus Roizmanbacteria bacterium CG10_big_fil_rev_8_21_14_0_10_45_7]|uniref:Lipid II flippase MurJ n=1 Tax=Candidatus Roizmanbacteria bacterium CG10_big_fil_rev_8_21_14_0_10_45_7 TaxID=1974854 RepID=A0A2M8KVH4_9BACT|nr:MAG: hypothetical protein COU89_00715 [Candidatus Roizmanbacteria bacterium CG10_big_fil_rev_8_21_14_0_10_45_7]
MFAKKLEFVTELYKRSYKTLFASTVIVVSTMVLARIFGLWKYRVLTSYYTGAERDLFFAAFRIPDLVFDVLILGSLSACYIPLISKVQAEDGEDVQRVHSFTLTLIVLFLLTWAVIVGVIFPLRYGLFQLVVPGFSPQNQRLAADLSMYLLLIQVPLLIVGNVYASYMQSRKQFLVPGLAQIAYTVGIVFSIIVGARIWGLRAALIGAGIGAFLYCLSLLPGMKLFTKGTRILPWNHPLITTFVVMFIPRLASMAIVQFDATIDVALASLKGVGAMSAFSLAQSLQIIPVTLIGVALGQAVLPFFVEYAHKKNYHELMRNVTRLLLLVFFVTMPFVVFFTTLRIPVTRLIFGGEKFDWDSTVSTAYTLSAFAISMPFHTAYYIIVRAFFSLDDTKTPLVVGFYATVFNSLLSVLFIVILKLPVWYLAVSFSISIALQVMTLYVMLVWRIDGIKLKDVLPRFVLIALIALVTAVLVWLLRKLLDGLVFDTTRTIQVLWLTATCVFMGLAVYGYAAWAFIPDEFDQLINLFKRLRVVKATIDRYTKLFYVNKTLTTMDEKHE